MADEGFGWIYLVFFLIIPLSRIVPRLVRKWKDRNQTNPEEFTQTTNQSTNESISEPTRKSFQFETQKEMSPKTLDMLVLGELNRGTKNFNSIQKNLGIDNNALEKILEGLEKDGLMMVQHKQAIFGPKIELIITEKGFKKFYS
ncbi:MAG: winged helix-turn-helix transcriptional regulator [Nitrosopumilaceae archaeon]